MAKKLVAELLGTFILVFFGVGSAVGGYNVIGSVGVAFAFGLALLALVYAIGPVSGCHVNPAVTLGASISGRIPATEAAGYWIAQFVGGVNLFLRTQSKPLRQELKAEA
jgi:aquaporin Z